jgi:hypothetical protein
MTQPTSTAPRYTVARTRASPCVDRECTSGRRNRYYLGKRLTADSLQVEQDYLVERRRLLNRAIHGYGVVYGYAVSVYDPNAKPPHGERGFLTVGPGLALDAAGRELLQVEALPLALEDVTLLDGDDHPVHDPSAAYAEAYGAAEAATQQQLPSGAQQQTQSTAQAPGQSSSRHPGPHTPLPKVCWLLSVHYAEEYIGPVTLNDPCSCERRDWDQVCETVRYSLRRIDCAKCCDGHPCELHCRCATTGCCDPKISEPNEPARWRRIARGDCRCLCEHLTGLRPEPECSVLRPCKDGVRVAWHNGVALACVSLRPDKCGGYEFAVVVEDCGPRRLVKRNDLLFDLIRGCDLTHIEKTSWHEWHRGEHRVKWSLFVDRFPEVDDNATECTTDFWVVFSRPVRKETLTPEAFAMTVMIGEYEGGWGNVLRVPIVRIDHNGGPNDPPDYANAFDPSDPPHYTRRARIVVDAGWSSDAIHGRKTQFLHQHTFVEIEVRGDYILDCNGQPIDANAYGLMPVPTGNGTPGGTYLSAFRLHAKS